MGASVLLQTRRANFAHYRYMYGTTGMEYGYFRIDGTVPPDRCMIYSFLLIGAKLLVPSTELVK